MTDSGHVFLIWSDLNELLCDAWLLPTDTRMNVLEERRNLHGQSVPPPPRGWGTGEVRLLRFPDWPSGEPVPHLTNVVSRELGPTVDAAVELVHRAAADIARDAALRVVKRRSKPLLGLPLVGTGAGGQRRWAGEVVAALLPELGRAAAESARLGHLVLFMGAGVSVPAGGPTWGELIAELARRAGLDAEEARALERLLRARRSPSLRGRSPTPRHAGT